MELQKSGGWGEGWAAGLRKVMLGWVDVMKRLRG
jgi:hypothetical protein